MAVGTSNRAQLAYILESTFGTTPGVGSMQVVRYTGESLDSELTFTESAEIIADRMTTDIVRTASRGAGAVNVELSYGAHDPWIEAAMCGTWATNVLKTGTTMRSFTLEKQFLDLTQFLAFPGQRIDTMRFDFRVGAIITGAFGFVGRAALPMAATTVRAGTTAATTNPVMASVDAIQVLTEGGSPLVGVQELSFSVSNGMRSLGVIDDDAVFDVNAGRQRLTGTFSLYFQDAVLYNKFRNLTYTALRVESGGATTLKYNFLIPRVRITKATIVAGGGDQDLMVQCEFTAVKDTTENSLMTITRTPAV